MLVLQYALRGEWIVESFYVVGRQHGHGGIISDRRRGSYARECAALCYHEEVRIHSIP